MLLALGYKVLVGLPVLALVVSNIINFTFFLHLHVSNSDAVALLINSPADSLLLWGKPGTPSNFTPFSPKIN